MMARLFVYGTLRKGKEAHSLLRESPFLAEARTTDFFHLLDRGGFPGISPCETQAGKGVLGELYEVSEEIFEQLDFYEAVQAGLFRRDAVVLQDGTEAIAYVFDVAEDDSPLLIVTSGVWP
jgi:gamma-glutamylcyclotransferase (GGCT)/AIG2-like uncharacterized protein YtfP